MPRVRVRSFLARSKLEITPLRNEKKDAIPEELKKYNERVDAVFSSMSVINKALTKLYEGPNLTTEKQKKYAEHRLSLAFHETAHTLSNASIDQNINSPLVQVVSQMAGLEANLANKKFLFEKQIHEAVVKDIGNILKSQPQIHKSRSQLKKAQQEYEMAENKLTSASRQTNAQSQNSEKIATLEKERNDALNSMEQLRNDLGTELYEFTAKESSHCELFTKLVHLQETYHNDCLKIIKENLEIIKKNNEEAKEEPSFGRRLKDHCDKETKIAFVIQKCCDLIRNNGGLTEEGLLRVPASTSRLKRFKAALDVNADNFDKSNFDVHTAAAALKHYLRELPEPLLLSGNYEDWTIANSESDIEKRKASFRKIINNLPESNRKNIQFLFQFLKDVEINQGVNKMTARNLAIVIGPNLMAYGTDEKERFISTQLGSTVTEFLLTNYDYFFNTKIVQESFKPTSAIVPPPRLTRSIDNIHSSTPSLRDSYNDIYSTSSCLISLGADPTSFHKEAHGCLDRQTRIATSNHSSLSFSSSLTDSSDLNVVRKKQTAPLPPDQKKKLSLSPTNSSSSESTSTKNPNNHSMEKEITLDVSSIESTEILEQNPRPLTPDKPLSEDNTAPVNSDVFEISDSPKEASTQIENTYL